MANEVKSIGILTSGGDAPGMNACIRAVVRSALNRGLRVYGIRRGYAGLLKGDLFEMDAKSVSNIIHQGGTMLYSARCPEFLEKETQAKAAKMCEVFGLDALVTIGGDGTFRGAQALSEFGVKVIGVPATIDLDVGCTDYTIGFDTAINIVMDCIARLRDTSASLERCSVVEVMGHHCGAIAIWSGITTGADAVMIPELEETQSLDYAARVIMENRARGKNHNIIIVAEGCYNCDELAKQLHELTGIDCRCAILGHLQRGGRPSALDVKHASMMGENAVNTLLDGKQNRVIAFKNGQYVDFDLAEALQMMRKPCTDVWDANLHLSSYH